MGSQESGWLPKAPTEKIKTIAPLNQDPDHNFPVPQELEGITKEEVLNGAYEVGTTLMQKIRKGRDAIRVGKDIVHFPLPVLGEPGRINSLVSLSTVGCKFAASGECAFCDYGRSTFKKPEVVASLKTQIEDAFTLIKKENSGHKRALINLTAIGSMFDPSEIPEDILLNVCDRIAEIVNSGEFPDGVEWTTESRLELVDKNILEKIKTAFSNHKIELGKQLLMDVGYGLESSNQLIVEGAMFKRVSKPYNEAVTLMREYGIKATAHTIFKPPFLTERESIEDAVKTVQDAFKDKICDTMLVMTMNVRNATTVGELAEQNMYQLPSLWSVVEIMKRLGSDICQKTHFFGFSVATEKAGTVVPKDEEEKKLMELILKFAGAREQWEEIMKFFDNASGLEKNKWEELLKNTPKHTLPERIAGGLDILSKKYVNLNYRELVAQEKEKKIHTLKVIQPTK